MKILVGVAIVYAIYLSFLEFQLTYLWPYRNDESFKKNPVNVDTNTENTVIVNHQKYSTMTTTGEISTTTEKILSIEDKDGSNIHSNKNESSSIAIEMDARKTSKHIFLGQDEYYDYSDMLHDYQLSESRDLINYTCTEKNERHALTDNSENYIECVNGTATLLKCLNGLHVDPEKIHVSPCQYAIDVPNTGEALPRKQLTSQCPHDFGFYKIVDEHNCSSFRICEFGIGYDYECPNGLAFRSDTLRCDWPHKVPECNAEVCIPTVYLVTTLWIRERNKTFMNQVDKSKNVLNKINQNYTDPEEIRNGAIHQDVSKHNNISEGIGTIRDNDKDYPQINSENGKRNSAIKNYTGKSIQDIFADNNDYVDMLYYHQLSVRRSSSNYTCIEKNGRYALPGSSEEYIECKNGTATHMQCLDGLHFDDEKANEKWPCQYSIDIPGGKKSTNHDKQTGECPHQFGYYKIEDAHNCSSFRICEFGIGYDFKCPNGLAFRSDTLRCDWPHKVPECNAEAYADFRCPENKPSFQFYRSPSNCQVHYICINGVPRRQVCEKYMGFDLVSNCCVPADRAKSCDQQLQLLASQYRKNKLEIFTRIQFQNMMTAIAILTSDIKNFLLSDAYMEKLKSLKL